MFPELRLPGEITPPAWPEPLPPAFLLPSISWLPGGCRAVSSWFWTLLLTSEEAGREEGLVVEPRLGFRVGSTLPPVLPPSAEEGS